MTDQHSKKHRLLIDQLIEVGKRAHQRGWVPATSGNFSARLDEKYIVITASGNHKGYLTADDFLVVDLAGASLETDLKPSAETLLHCERYRALPFCKAVLHTHSSAVTRLTRRGAEAVTLTGYELLKALPTVTTHDTSVTIPVFNNGQDMIQLAAQVSAASLSPDCSAYLISGHGIYSWGSSVMRVWEQLEALEFMFECELQP